MQSLPIRVCVGVDVGVGECVCAGECVSDDMWVRVMTSNLRSKKDQRVKPQKNGYIHSVSNHTRE
jgi:hypothetical protein